LTKTCVNGPVVGAVVVEELETALEVEVVVVPELLDEEEVGAVDDPELLETGAVVDDPELLDEVEPDPVLLVEVLVLVWLWIC
jgi:hypothetical protein